VIGGYRLRFILFCITPFELEVIFMTSIYSGNCELCIFYFNKKFGAWYLASLHPATCGRQYVHTHPGMPVNLGPARRQEEGNASGR